jgi:hypothetical protein
VGVIMARHRIPYTFVQEKTGHQTQVKNVMDWFSRHREALSLNQTGDPSKAMQSRFRVSSTGASPERPSVTPIRSVEGLGQPEEPLPAYLIYPDPNATDRGVSRSSGRRTTACL